MKDEPTKFEGDVLDLLRNKEGVPEVFKAIEACLNALKEAIGVAAHEIERLREENADRRDRLTKSDEE